MNPEEDMKRSLEENIRFDLETLQKCQILAGKRKRDRDKDVFLQQAGKVHSRSIGHRSLTIANGRGSAPSSASLWNLHCQDQLNLQGRDTSFLFGANASISEQRAIEDMIMGQHMFRVGGSHIGGSGSMMTSQSLVPPNKSQLDQLRQMLLLSSRGRLADQKDFLGNLEARNAAAPEIIRTLGLHASLGFPKDSAGIPIPPTGLSLLNLSDDAWKSEGSSLRQMQHDLLLREELLRSRLTTPFDLTSLMTKTNYGSMLFKACSDKLLQGRSRPSQEIMASSSLQNPHLRPDCTSNYIFPVKLHKLLCDLESQNTKSGERNDIASFLPDGSAFAVFDSIRFESYAMKIHFPRMSTFASFQRQLNLYDFKRIEKGAYYHPHFKRDFPELCTSMKRRRTNSRKM